MNTPIRNDSASPAADLIGIARRRKALAVVTALLVIAGFTAYTFTATQSYRARTLVAIEPATRTDVVPMDYAARVQYQLHVVREVLFGEAVFKTVVKEFRLDSDNPLMKSGAPLQRVLEEIRSRVKVELDGESAFYIAYEGADSKQVAEVANRLAELLSLRTSAQRDKRNEQETGVVESEVVRLRNRLLDLEAKIEQYKLSAVDELPERVDTNLKFIEGLQTQIREVSNALSTEDARRAGILTEMSEMERQDMLKDPVTPTPRSRNAEKLDDLRADRDRLLARGYTSIHPEIVRMEKEIATLKPVVDAERPPTAVRTATPFHMRYAQLKAELDTVDRRMNSLRQERTSLNDQLPAYSRRVSASPRHEQALTQLTREYGVTRTQYEEQLNKQGELRRASQVDKVTQSVVFRVLEPAMPPLDPFAPNRLRLMLIGLVASTAAGLGMAMLMERTDSTFKDVEDLQNPTGLRVLTIIPRIEGAQKRGKSAKGAITAASSPQQPRRGIVTLMSPKSVPAEQFHILAAQLRRNAPPGDCTVTMVTSAATNEGKTLTSINLAMALANSGARVLLIDADLRLPRVHDYLGLRVEEGQGLSKLLADGNGGLATCAVDVSGLTVLPEKSAARNPLALLSSAELADLMTRLRQHFQFIIVDSPPILPIADAMVLGAISDQILLVVRARHTTPVLLRRAMECLDSTKVAGVVLNDVNISHLTYSYVYRDYQNTYLRNT